MHHHLIPINEIIVEDRQRIDYGDVQELADSISKYGLIQPIVLTQEKRLLAGGRRLAAHKLLGRETIDCVYRETLTQDEAFVIELEENIRRKQMSWQEECLNISTIHYAKQKLSAADAVSWGQRETGAMLNESAASINFALKGAALLKAELDETGKPKPDARFWKCEHLSAALKLYARDQEDLLRAELARRSTQFLTQSESSLVDLVSTYSESDVQAATEFLIQSGTLEVDQIKEEARTRYLSNPLNDPSQFDAYYQSRLITKRNSPVANLSRRLFNADSITHMREHPATYDHVITDIPYGIDMAMLNQQNPHGQMSDLDTIEELHDVDYNKQLIRDFFPAAYSCIKDKGFCITWMDISHWQFMFDCAEEAGFVVQKWPVVWIKTSACMNQTPAYNTTKNIEFAIVCRKKGTVILSQPNTSVITSGRDDLCQLVNHPFAKPFAIWEYLINFATMEGQSILEPFAGRGSGMLSMLRMNRNAFGVELDVNHYNALVENVKTHHYLKQNSEYKFI